MSKYQYSKLVMEKYLRRSFYDAVLELYEAAQGARIISVSLEGTLSLVVNKDDNFLIKLNEVAQRADDREEHLRYKVIDNMKLEGADHYIVKKEEPPYHCPPSQPFLSSEQSDITSMELNQKDWSKLVVENGDVHGKLGTVVEEPKGAKLSEVLQEKAINEHKSESDTAYEKSSDAESDSEDETEQEVSHPHHLQGAAPDYGSSIQGKSDLEGDEGDDICFITVGHMDEHKRKIDVKDSDHIEAMDKKSPHKRRKTADGEEDCNRTEDIEKVAGTISTPGADDSANSGLQLLPHTATAPIIVEDEENYSGGQMAQLAMLQMRESNLNMFRPQDLEELARQQQWQMVAYQRSFMEKSYIQHQMQQYQRDTERLRWEYAAAHQARDYPQSGEEVEKLYRQAAQAQNSGAEAALLAAAALEEAKKSSRDVGDLTPSSNDKMTSQYLRILSDDPGINQPDADYEEGELRPESHNCALCNTKFSSMELLLRHMEKHRVAFERSCSVCQSGTLTGNMLILHMEASHGPESSFPLPSSAPPVTMSATVSSSMISTVIEYPQPFPTATSNYNGASTSLDGTSSVKLPSQPHSPKHVTGKEHTKDESVAEGLQTLNYHLATVSSHPPAPPVAASSSATSSGSSQENFLGIPPQFYPLIGCQICGEKFALSEALDQHVESQHKELQCNYSCKPCALTFTKHVELSKHMSRHETASANLKCSHCLKSFKSVKQLRLHYVAAHACCHFCEYCRAGFPDSVALQVHEQLHTLDPEKLSYRCDICNKAFYTQSQCSAHKRTHKDEKAHACELCGSAFFKRGDLTKHVRTVHSPSRLFACKFCGKKGTRMDNMRSHVRSHHKNMTRDQIINMIEVIE